MIDMNDHQELDSVYNNIGRINTANLLDDKLNLRYTVRMGAIIIMGSQGLLLASKTRGIDSALASMLCSSCEKKIKIKKI